jgi:hypothetical protein
MNALLLAELLDFLAGFLQWLNDLLISLLLVHFLFLFTGVFLLGIR